MQASDCDANASFSSITSKSPIRSPRRSISLRVDGTGPMPMMRGGTPAEARPRMRARGVRPCFFTAASEAAVKKHGLTPRARILGLASAAVPPRIMGIGPVPATKKLVERLGIKVSDFDLIELNEAFASQGIACLRQLGVKEDADFVNPHGGAIALGHPLGMSGARLAMTAVHGMEKRGGKLALATMCVGVGQGVAVAIEKLN